MHTVNLMNCPKIIVEHLFPNKTIKEPCYIHFSSPEVITFSFSVLGNSRLFNINDYALIRDDLDDKSKELFDLVATNTTHEPKAANMALEFLAKTLEPT